ncbi:histidine kinase N-terminal 7TM domain-containing protein, partial [Planomonospora alba]|uniref:histidine kinase N-terminal 7TM domain-containing protein n=1 Tax=Planomonospora alba TaxID=161354 RepID=UPI0031EC4BDD
MTEPLLALVFMLSALMSLAVAVSGWYRRHVTPAVGALSVLATAISAWSVLDGILLLDDDLRVALPLLLAKFLAVCVMPAGFYCLSLAVADRAWRPARRLLRWLAAEPALVTVALLTDPWHHLFITGPRTGELAYGGVGPLFWAHTAYSYTLLAVGIGRLVRAWLRGPRSQRGLYGSTLLATLPPLLLNVVSTMGVARVDYLTPVGFCATTIIVYLTLVRRSLHELVPVERTHVFDMIGDMVMTVDGTGRILDLNPAAERLIRQLAPGLPIRLTGFAGTDVFGRIPLSDGMELDHTVTDAQGRAIDLNVRVSALRDSRQTTIGWAFVA